MYRSDFKDHSVSIDQFTPEAIKEIETQSIQHKSYIPIKRVLDILFFLVLLIPSVILILLFGILIKLDSKGPVFFNQERVGLNMKCFKAYKLRSMVHSQHYQGPEFTELGDRRITRVGKFIRRFRIDELPQIFNVLLGHMSFIGPRPLAQYEYKFSHPIFEKRTIVKPGITGLAQVEGGNDFTNLEKFKYDMKYIKEMSFLTDLKLVFETIGVIISGKGSR